jgi:hypothetical protein
MDIQITSTFSIGSEPLLCSVLSVVCYADEAERNLEVLMSLFTPFLDGSWNVYINFFLSGRGRRSVFASAVVRSYPVGIQRRMMNPVHHDGNDANRSHIVCTTRE